jgi:hypothetical protein
MLLMTLNLLSRFCINIDIIIPDNILSCIKSPHVNDDYLLQSLLNLSRSINPLVNINYYSDTEKRYDCVIAIGNYQKSYGKTIAINSDGWISFINTEGNTFNWTSDNHNPIGAYTAAALSVAELYKIIFKRIMKIPRIGAGALSSFDYGFQTSPSSNPALPSDIKIDNLHFVSMGAINSAVLYGLCAIPGLVISARITEPETLDFSNLNRYIFSTFLEAFNHTSKIESAINFSRDKLNVTNKHTRLFEKANANIHDDEIAIVGVDNNEGRWAVQACKPRILLCGGTNENGLARITRHSNDVNEYCLRCEYTEPSIKSAIPEPTISFVSAITGVLLAGEIIKMKMLGWEKYQLRNFFEMEVLRSHCHKRFHKKKRHNCPLH